MMDKSGTTLSSIQMVFEKEIVIKENALEIRGIPFCETEDADHNAYILDYGRLTPENATHFGKADLSVLVGCTKPWELPAFADALRLVVSHPCRQMVTLASFSTQQDMARSSPICSINFRYETTFMKAIPVSGWTVSFSSWNPFRAICRSGC